MKYIRNHACAWEQTASLCRRFLTTNLDERGEPPTGRSVATNDRVLIHSFMLTFGIRVCRERFNVSTQRGRAAVCQYAKASGPRNEKTRTMVSALVKTTPDYRSGALPSSANLQESERFLSGLGIAARPQTDR